MLNPIDFIRKASGLYVPPLIGLAVNPLGRFQPCEPGSCCGGVECLDNCIGNTASSEYQVVIDGFSNSNCTVCEDYNDTYILANNAPCGWRFDATYICIEFFSFALFKVQLIIGAGTIQVDLIDGHNLLFLEQASAQWVKDDLPIPFDCTNLSDLDIPLIGVNAKMSYFCNGSPTCKVTSL